MEHPHVVLLREKPDEADFRCAHSSFLIPHSSFLIPHSNFHFLVFFFSTISYACILIRNRCIFKILMIFKFFYISHAYIYILHVCCPCPCPFLLADISFLVLTVNRPLKINDIDQFRWYCAIVITLIVFGSSALSFFRFFVTRLEITLMEPTFGFGGVYIMILMIYRQQYKGEPIFSFFPHITFHNMPVIFLNTQIVFWFCGLTAFTHDISFTLLSLLLSWSYLRFFYKFDPNGPINNNVV